jgi:hypothetical protein
LCGRTDRGAGGGVCHVVLLERVMQAHEVHALAILGEQRLQRGVQVTAVRALEVSELDHVDLAGLIQREHTGGHGRGRLDRVPEQRRESHEAADEEPGPGPERAQRQLQGPRLARHEEGTDRGPQRRAVRDHA